MTDIILFGDANCHKSRFYEAALKERGLAYVFEDVAQNQNSETKLRALFEDGEVKFPTFVIKGRTIRNPSLKELDKVLAREEIRDPGIIHEPKSQRFVKYMKPKDAFVSYARNESRITLTHIEVPHEKRGTGMGARLALKVFPMVKEMGLTANITCSFMRKVAASKPEWADYFGVAR